MERVAEFCDSCNGGFCDFRCSHFCDGLCFRPSDASYLEKEIERCGLQNLVSQVLVPTEKVYKIRDGKRISSERLFYPGYVLIEAELTGELQYIIRNEVPHMSGFLTEKRDVSRGTGKAQEEKIPVPIRESEVKRILGEQERLL